jgi:general secretion pathway protein J
MKNRPPPHRGFTLVEILIALTLLALVMLGLLSAMRTFAQTGERIEARLLKTDELRLVSSFVHEILSSASARPLPALKQAAQGTGQAPLFLFYGQPQELVFLGTMPARHGPGGLHFMRIALFGPQEHRVLGIQFRPLDPLAETLDWENHEPEWLVEGVTQFQIQYQPIEGGPWRTHWQDPSTLPGFVRFVLSDTQGPWPEWVTPIRAALVGAQPEQ